MEPHHLYVHVPFCRLVCAYCDFVTVGGRGQDIGRYTDALLAELALRPTPGELRTIYFGGGTPSLMTPEQVGRIIGAANDRWGSVALEEVTLEAELGSHITLLSKPFSPEELQQKVREVLDETAPAATAGD